MLLNRVISGYFLKDVVIQLCGGFFNVFIFYILRDRDRALVGEGQRERDTQSLKQAPGSELSAQSPTWGSNPRTVRS